MNKIIATFMSAVGMTTVERKHSILYIHEPHPCSACGSGPVMAAAKSLGFKPGEPRRKGPYVVCISFKSREAARKVLERTIEIAEIMASEASSSCGWRTHKDVLADWIEENC